MAERKLGVSIVADARQFIASFRTAGAEVKTFEEQVVQASVEVKRGAELQVQASVRIQQRLREQIAAYHQVASAAKVGSAEQVAAADLAAKAEARLARSLGATAVEAGAMGRSSASAERDISRASRGALAGAGAFKGLGRSVAYASTWFIGGAGLVYAVKQAVNQAASLEDQMQRTRAVFGPAAAEVNKFADTSIRSAGLSKAAFLDASNTIGTLLQNVGQTPRAAAAMSHEFVQLAADMDAFAKKTPGTALAALEAGLTGRTRSLKQFGLVIDNTTIKAEALSKGIIKSAVDPSKIRDAQTAVSVALARQQLATRDHGATSIQAVSATVQLHSAQRQLAKDLGGTTGQLTAQQKTLAIYDLILAQTARQRGSFARNSDQLAVKERVFRAALADTEAAIGTALLPTVSKYLGELGDWLSKSQNQAKVQHDVRGAVDLLRSAINAATPFVKAAAGALREFSHAVGGAKNAIEILGGALLLNKVSGGIGKIGSVATTAEGPLGVLVGTLGRLKTLAAEAIVVDVIENLIIPKHVRDKGKQIVDQGGGGPLSDIPLVGGALDAGAYYGRQTRNAVAGAIGIHPAKKPETTAQILAGIRANEAKGAPHVDIGKPATTFAKIPTSKGGGASGSGSTAGGYTPSTPSALSIALSEAQASGNASAIKAATDAKLAYDVKAAAFAKKRIDAGKGNPALVAQYQNVLADEASLRSNITLPPGADKQLKIPVKLQVAEAKASTTLTQADDIAAAKAIKKWTLAVINSRHLQGQELADAYNIISQANSTITGGGGFSVPMKLQVAEAKAGTTASQADDVAAAKAIKKWTLAVIKSRHLQGQALIDAYNTITQANSTIGNQTRTSLHTIKLVTGKDLLRGLDLSPSQRKELEARYAQQQAHHGHRPTGIGALGQTVTVHGDLVLNGVQNPRQLQAELDKLNTHGVGQRRGHTAGQRPH